MQSHRFVLEWNTDPLSEARLVDKIRVLMWNKQALGNWYGFQRDFVVYIFIRIIYQPYEILL